MANSKLAVLGDMVVGIPVLACNHVDRGMCGLGTAACHMRNALRPSRQAPFPYAASK